MQQREGELEVDDSDGPWDLSWARKEAEKGGGGCDKGWGKGWAASLVATSGAAILRPKWGMLLRPPRPLAWCPASLGSPSELGLFCALLREVLDPGSLSAY